VEKSLNLAALESSRVRVVFISHGSSHRVLRGYLKAFRLSYELYTDPTPNRELYQALGMTLMTKFLQPRDQRPEQNPQSPRLQAARGLVRGLTKFFTGARDMLKYKQSGGEFLFGPGYQCEFAHRMYTAKGGLLVEHDKVRLF